MYPIRQAFFADSDRPWLPPTDKQKGCLDGSNDFLRVPERRCRSNWRDHGTQLLTSDGPASVECARALGLTLSRQGACKSHVGICFPRNRAMDKMEPLGNVSAQSGRARHRHRVETTAKVQPHALGVERASHANEYTPVPARGLSRALAELPIDYPEWDFVDLGAGKGRALFVASRFAFRKIIGVELSADLCAIARRNITTYRDPQQKCLDLRLVGWGMPRDMNSQVPE
jgi:hypothetical protein